MDDARQLRVAKHDGREIIVWAGRGKVRGGYRNRRAYRYRVGRVLFYKNGKFGSRYVHSTFELLKYKFRVKKIRWCPDCRIRWIGPKTCPKCGYVI